MKLKLIKINNYKSFKSDTNQLFVSNINTVVGKNESGKSNLIEAVGNIGTIGLTPKDYFNKKNKNSLDNITIELKLELTTEEKKRYKYDNNILITINGYKNCEYNIEFGEALLKNKKVQQIRKKILDFIDENNVHISKPENRAIYDPIINDIKNIDKKIIIKPDGYDNFIDRLKATKNDIIDELCSLFEELFGILDDIYKDFPTFILLSNRELKNTYNNSELYAELNDNNSILHQLLWICDIEFDDFIKTANLKDPTEIFNKLEEYNDLIKKNFVEKFNDFYKQELIDMKIIINSQEVTIAIKTKGKFLPIEERSNGLKWYINIFIQLMYRDLNIYYKNKIILLDEPGVFLHSIAQEELMNLLYNLSKKDNQIIYTTHSPSMINFDKIQNIRAIEKDENGNSCIYNKISEFPIDSKSKHETITPIINAMGYKMKYNVGINSKKTNIIVEGITDYFYLQSYMLLKDIKDYNIIASTGANNIPAISSILYGWGCQFVILLDNDTKGRSVYDSIHDSEMPYKDKIIFANGKEYTKDMDEEIEDLFSETDRKKFNLNSSDYKEKKYFYAYSTYERITTNKEKYNGDTISNFENLFENIDKIK